jgi:hypothetical protein
MKALFLHNAGSHSCVYITHDESQQEPKNVHFVAASPPGNCVSQFDSAAPPCCESLSLMPQCFPLELQAALV